jgi:L-threonylcarbamoyladenylate synthase
MSDSTLDRQIIRAAARRLEEGALVAFPTETVYGLGADAENPQAIAKIYAAKGRPSNHPVIVHVAEDADIEYWASAIPDQACQLIDTFWPGPLTLILKRAPHIPDAVSGGQDSIGLRCPSHPVARALLQQFKAGKGGIAAPSANKFGHVSPTTAQHVRDEFGPTLECVLDGGQSEVGIESTIIDLSRIDTHGPVLLRPGHIGADRLAQVIGVAPRMPDASAPRASGTLDSHYAPRTPAALVELAELGKTLQRLAAVGQKVTVICHTAAPLANVIGQLALPPTAAGYAHELYAALRTADATGADIILIEAPPSSSEWQGINDRLRRAAHDSRGIIALRLAGATLRSP